MNFRSSIYFIACGLTFLAISGSGCSEEEIKVYNYYELEIPEGFPEPDIPTDNFLTVERVELGKKLFFDPSLSIDSTISCGSCHKQNLAFTDGLQVSLGVEDREGFRNAPTLANVTYLPVFLLDGGTNTLEKQVLVPIDDHNEMGFNMALLVERLQQDEEYQDLALKAYERNMDAFVITRAIAAYERILISGNSPYDQYVFQGNEEALSDPELRGLGLFESERLSCSGCHIGFNFTSSGFENNGLYEVYSDTGRARITGLPKDVGRFKIPTLRNIGQTAPYMHDGSLQTLEEVIEHYNSGGQDHINKNPLIQPLALTEGEKSDLLAFLHSLTDNEFLSNPEYAP